MVVAVRDPATDLIKDPLELPLPDGRFGEGDTIHVDRDGDRLSFKKVACKRRSRKPATGSAKPRSALIERGSLAATTV